MLQLVVFFFLDLICKHVKKKKKVVFFIIKAIAKEAVRNVRMQFIYLSIYITLKIGFNHKTCL